MPEEQVVEEQVMEEELDESPGIAAPDAGPAFGGDQVDQIERLVGKVKGLIALTE